MFKVVGCIVGGVAKSAKNMRTYLVISEVYQRNIQNIHVHLECEEQY